MDLNVAGSNPVIRPISRARFIKRGNQIVDLNVAAPLWAGQGSNLSRWKRDPVIRPILRSGVKCRTAFISFIQKA